MESCVKPILGLLTNDDDEYSFLVSPLVCYASETQYSVKNVCLTILSYFRVEQLFELFTP